MSREDNGSEQGCESPREFCGIFGIYGDPEAAEKTYLGLYALQHRGQESSGIASSNGAEIVLHLIARSEEKFIEEMIIELLTQLKGAYCFVFLTPSKLIAARDPYGFRPLCLGKTGDAAVVASESCALDIIGAEYVRDVEPGEVVIVDVEGITSLYLPAARRKALCVFEYI